MGHTNDNPASGVVPQGMSATYLKQLPVEAIAHMRAEQLEPVFLEDPSYALSLFSHLPKDVAVQELYLATALKSRDLGERAVETIVPILGDFNHGVQICDRIIREYPSLGARFDSLINGELKKLREPSMQDVSEPPVASTKAIVDAPSASAQPLPDGAIPPAVGEVLPEAQPATVAVPEVAPIEPRQEALKRRYRFGNEADALELLPILTKQMRLADKSAAGKRHFAAGEAGILKIIENFPHLAGDVERATNHLGLRSPRIHEQLAALIDHVRIPSDTQGKPFSNPRDLSSTAHVLEMFHEVRDRFGQVIAVPDSGPFPRIKHPEKQGRAVTPPQKVHP